MNNNSFASIHEAFLSLNKIKFNSKELRKEIESFSQQKESDIDDYIHLLIESGNLVELAYFRNWLEIDVLKNLLSDIHYPILVFFKENNVINPCILFRKNGSLNKIFFRGEEIIQTEISEDISDLPLVTGKEIHNFPDTKDKILVITCFPNKSVFTQEKKEEEHHGHDHHDAPKWKTLSRFFRLITHEKREIGYILIYAVISGIISLSLPLGIQSIIGFISSGQISTSVVVLIGFIILGIMIVGGLQIMQLTLVEYIRQRLFSKTAFEFAFRIPKIKIESVLKYYPPELMNRFFDIVTLQKGLAKILLEFTGVLLQVIMGLILLSFYHYTFIFFGVFLIAMLTVIIRMTGPAGLRTSLNESKYKYMLANWLEEIARALSTFKLAGYSNLPMEKTDYFVSNYLHARRSHFRILLTQYASFVTFKTLIAGGLLILGCILLVNRQINLGQFVASEIVIILIINAVEKVIINLDTVYDVLTSIEKIGAVTDLPIEHPKGINIENFTGREGLSVKIKNLKYKYPAEPYYMVKGLNLEINAGERVCISGYSSSGKTTFINIILGFLTSYEGVVTFNNISLRDINKNSLISLTGDNISQQDLFDGTILENITISRSRVNLDDVLWAVECVGLNDFIYAQKEGLNTKLTGGSMGISESIARKIIIARSIVTKPKLLILEDFLLGLEKSNKLQLLELLIGRQFSWTLIIISNDPEIMKLCDRTLIMKEGNIVAQGTFSEILEDPHFKELI